MATIQTLIERSLQKLLCEEDTTQFSATQLSHGLTAVNAMLESWSLERLKQFKMTLSTFNTANGTASYAIGTGLTWNTSLPVEIESAFIRVSNEDKPVTIIKRRTWMKLQKKTEANRPTKLYFERTDNAAGVVYLHPVPTATEAIYLDMRKGIVTYAALSDTVTLPPGYERAIVFNLAIELAPDYEIEPSTTIKEKAAESLAVIMDLNTPSENAGLKANEPQDRGRVADTQKG